MWHSGISVLSTHARVRHSDADEQHVERIRETTESAEDRLYPEGGTREGGLVVLLLL
jgi:hypothetical protein